MIPVHTYNGAVNAGQTHDSGRVLESAKELEIKPGPALELAVSVTMMSVGAQTRLSVPTVACGGSTSAMNAPYRQLSMQSQVEAGATNVTVVRR